MRLEITDLPRTAGGTFSALRKALQLAINRNKDNERYVTILRSILQTGLDFLDAYEETRRTKEPTLAEKVQTFTDKDKFEDWVREEFDIELDGRATLLNMQKEFVEKYKATRKGTS